MTRSIKKVMWPVKYHNIQTQFLNCFAACIRTLSHDWLWASGRPLAGSQKQISDKLKMFIVVTVLQQSGHATPCVNSLPHVSRALQGLPYKALPRSESGDVDAEGKPSSIARGGVLQNFRVSRFARMAVLPR